MNESKSAPPVEDEVHRLAMFTVHHLRHLIRDLEKPLSRKYRAAWGDDQLAVLASATEALWRLVKLDDVDRNPEDRVPEAVINEWRQGFALLTGAEFLLHHLRALNRCLWRRKAANIRTRLGAEYLLSLAVAVKVLEELQQAARDWPGPAEPALKPWETN